MPEADRVMIVEVVQKIAERLNPQPEEDYGFMDDMRCITACLPWTTLRVPHRAYLRPQAPQPPTTTFLIFSSRQEKVIEDKPIIFTIFFLLSHDVGHQRLTQVVVSLQ